MPSPLSSTSQSTCSASRQARTVILPPAAVNLMALPIRLPNTCSMRWGSIKATNGFGGSNSKSATGLQCKICALRLQYDVLYRGIVGQVSGKKRFVRSGHRSTSGAKVQQ